MDEDEVAGYVAPWKDPARVRSWMAMAAAADAKYDLDLVPALVKAA
ncbi:MAG: alpha/beta hydrolase, partial [Pseudarthrobacter sp.]|nr:alpha/beta hydrolase [Pseudarthrobacter sp.]